MPRASAWKAKISPSRTQNPAATPTAAPCASRLALSSISAFASSISSRIKIDAFSDTRVTRSPMDLSATLPFTGRSSSGATAPHEPREQEAPPEGGGNERDRVGGETRRLVGRRAIAVRGRRRVGGGDDVGCGLVLCLL